MGERRVTIVVSDLHVGGGPADPGDDFIYQDDQFPRMVHQIGATPEGTAGQVELIINGDFLELAQIEPKVYKLNSAKYWCSEAESLQKLEMILSGHAEIFRAIDGFQKLGNAVMIAPGNHDIDLHWGGVKDRIRAAAPGVEFETGTVWMTRYGGRMRISHGNQLDPANRFTHWDNPVLLADHAEMRLEMCPGTLFMVRFVNWLEKCYPFADNLHPVTKIAGILAKEDKFGLVAVSWMLARFAARHPIDFLGSEPQAGLQTGKQLLEAVKYDAAFRVRLAEVYRQVRHDPAATEDTVGEALGSEDALAAFMADAMAVIEMESWLALFDMAKPETLHAGDASADTLAIIRSGNLADDTWRKEAEEQWRQGAEIVVIGHTHMPETAQQDGKSYYNPGSWTRYVRREDLAGLKLEDLKKENKFPYQLNYVRVEQTDSGRLSSSMICFEERKSFS